MPPPRSTPASSGPCQSGSGDKDRGRKATMTDVTDDGVVTTIWITPRGAVFSSCYIKFLVLFGTHVLGENIRVVRFQHFFDLVFSHTLAGCRKMRNRNLFTGEERR